MALADLEAVAGDICKQRSWTLIRELGAGAHKRAYLIEHSGNQLALKIAPITPSLKPRFEREAVALRGCAHPAIANLHESSALDFSGREYWVSIEEYLAFGTLAERSAGKRMASEDVRRIGLVIADALLHLRQRNLVHRDIKPTNILFRTEVDPVLTDFGIVRVLDAPTLTQDFLPQGPGTPLYAAPEQLLNEIPLIDWRTDQFGLALVLAQCALGYHAFGPEGDFPLAVSRVARRESLPTRSQADLKAAGLSSLLKALSPWPVERYRTPETFLTALSTG